MACSLPSGDLYVFYLGNTTQAPEVEHAHHFQNSDSSMPSAIAVSRTDSFEVNILLSCVSVPGQQYADKIKLIRTLEASSVSPSFVQKEISTNTIGPISVFSGYSSTVVIGSTRHYESAALNSAQLTRIRIDSGALFFSPPGAAEFNSISSYTHSSLGASVTNVVLADLETLRSNVYHSNLGDVVHLSPDSSVLTDEIKLTEDGFQTIQPLTLELDFAYSFGASASSTSESLAHSVDQCQGATWEVAEAKVGGVDVPWVTTRTPNTFSIEPSLATGPGVC